MALTVAELQTVLSADIKDFKKGIDAAQKQAEGFSKDASKSFDKFSGVVDKASRNMTKFASVPTGAFLTASVKGASDLNEVMSKVDVVFGESAKDIHAWSAGAAKALGLAQVDAENAAGSFGNMFTQIGFTRDETTKMSKNIVGLSADFASFHNADITQVLDAQAAAFRGEYDALQRFLPLINAATVEQKAMEMTGKTNTDALTQQEKALAVYQLTLEGAGPAQGDFARTSDSMANQSRIATAETKNLSDKLGTQLLPAVTQVTSFMANSLIPTLDKLSGGNGALVLLGVAAAGPVLNNVNKLVGGIKSLNLTLDATAVKAAAALGAVGIVVGGVQQVQKDLDKGWAHGLLGSSPVSRFLDRTFHDGGVVPGPRGADVPIMAAGGETILPTHKPGWSGAGGGGQVINITVNGALDPNAVGQQVLELLRQQKRRQGDLGLA